MDEVSGSVDYDLKGQLPSDSQLVVELKTANVPITRKVIDISGQPPHSFSLSYNPRSVGEKNTYSLSADIKTADGRLLFTNDIAYDVITRGNPSRVSMKLVPTSLAERLITDTSPKEDQNEQTPTESELIGTVPVEDKPAAGPDPIDPSAESSGGGLAFLIILIVVIGFIGVLIARHRVTHTDEKDEDDEAED